MALALLALGVFIVGAVLVIGAYSLIAGLPQWLVQRRIQQRIDDVSTVLKPEPTEMASLVKGQVKGVIPALDRIASDTEYGGWLARLIDQAGAKTGVSTVLLSSLVLGAATAFALTAMLREPHGADPPVRGVLPRGAGHALPRHQGGPCLHHGHGHGRRRGLRSDRA